MRISAIAALWVPRRRDEHWHREAAPMAVHPRSHLLVSSDSDGCEGTTALSEALLKHNADIAQHPEHAVHF